MVQTPMPNGDVALADGRILRLQSHDEWSGIWKTDDGLSAHAISYHTTNGVGLLTVIVTYAHSRSAMTKEVVLVRKAFFGDNPVEIEIWPQYFRHVIKDKETTAERYRRLLGIPWPQREKKNKLYVVESDLELGGGNLI